MASSLPPPRPPPPAPFTDIEITVISAKHLKNVNWRNGPLVPYAALYLDPDHRLSTRPDDSNSTRPVWNERFTLPLASPDSILSVDVFHSRPSETPKPLVGSLRVPASRLLPDSPSAPPAVHSLELLRPSGRPQGKLRLKVSLRERTPLPPRFYSSAPGSAYYYSSATPGYYTSYDYYSPPSPAYAFIRPSNQALPRPPSAPVDSPAAPPPPPNRACGHLNENSNTNSLYGPSAPVDFTYPAEEREPCPSPRPAFNYATSSPSVSVRRLSNNDFQYFGPPPTSPSMSGPRLSSDDFQYVAPPHPWSFNRGFMDSARTVSLRNDRNFVSSERERTVAPSAPAGSSVYGHKRALDEASVAGSFGRLNLEEGNVVRGSGYAYSDSCNYKD